jgi:hypothetical protein
MNSNQAGTFQTFVTRMQVERNITVTAEMVKDGPIVEVNVPNFPAVYIGPQRKIDSALKSWPYGALDNKVNSYMDAAVWSDQLAARKRGAGIQNASVESLLAEIERRKAVGTAVTPSAAQPPVLTPSQVLAQVQTPVVNPEPKAEEKKEHKKAA